MKAYGTNVIAGVNPGQGGQTLHDIPVFDLVEQALAEVGPVDTTIIFVPLPSAGCGLEAITAGIRQIIIISAGMPPLDMVLLTSQNGGNRNPGSWTEQSGYHCARKDSPGTHASEFYTPDQ